MQSFPKSVIWPKATAQFGAQRFAPTCFACCCPFCRANRLWLFGQKGNVSFGHSNSRWSLLSVFPANRLRLFGKKGNASLQHASHVAVRFAERIGFASSGKKAPCPSDTPTRDACCCPFCRANHIIAIWAKGYWNDKKEKICL